MIMRPIAVSSKGPRSGILKAISGNQTNNRLFSNSTSSSQASTSVLRFAWRSI